MQTKKNLSQAEKLMFKDSSILVTGGTGSFGKALVRSLLDQHDPRRVIIFSRDELKQYEMQSSEPLSGDRRVRYFIGDVRDIRRLEMALRGVDYVFHAAALKQVPAAEYNPFECIHTNVLGAENVVQASINQNIKRVIALSTDKAANPVNLYGASKLASDKIFIAANHLSGSGGPRFSVVRYGNVIGSRGSVVPAFIRLREQQAQFLPITDKRMTRFWITLNAGVEFVLQSMNEMLGGEIFIPKIPSMRVTDLAEVIAPEMPQQEVGIRGGEKLHEALIPEEDARSALEFSDRFVVEPRQLLVWEQGIYEQRGGQPVMEGFSYTSDKNEHWLEKDEIRKYLRSANIEVPG
jgi:UDP-N-acetylglucosamine 4,6-dehydratase/5-epimerase